ncbi:PREDICTED: putative gustatory receptor 22a [Rhagoletis zephyria]|uniref:putative gustatory receptor 22a n=1 Tax=Rhagoletis zephyria TaxID=28612 RepID=UPI0008114CD8|nr:PREDICTED: putative gustatory receptor 22a [Rhagoletis zephyria]
MAFICNFGSSSSSSSSTKDKRIIWKFILMVLDIIFFVITMLTSKFKKDCLYIFLIICGVVILTEIDLIMNQFYHNVLYINDVVTAINNQLRSLRTSKHLAAVLPFRYNAKLKTVTPSKYCQAYSICVKALIALLCFYHWSLKDFLDLSIFQENDAIELLTSVMVMTNMYALIAIFILNWREYSTVLNIFNEFAAIERIYYARHSILAQKCTTYDNYIILKGLATLLQNISFLLVVFIGVNEPDIYAVGLVGFLLILSNTIFVVVLHFCNFTITTYRCIWIMQRRLQYMADYDIKIGGDAACVANEIYEIAGTYMRLLKLCKQFGRVYGQQLLLSIFGIMCANIQTLYLLRILWSERVVELSNWDIFFTLQAVLINIFDFWLTTTVCELVLCEARDMAQVLRCFDEIAQMDLELERSVDILVAICRNNYPQFRLGGLIDLNHDTGLKTLLTMILYLIYLVQFSYNDF